MFGTAVRGISRRRPANTEARLEITKFLHDDDDDVCDTPQVYRRFFRKAYFPLETAAESRRVHLGATAARAPRGVRRIARAHTLV